MRRRTTTTILLTTLLLAGCGGGGDEEGSGDGGGGSSTASGDGKSLFVSSCGGCHTLSDAETTGTSGPKLDGMGLDKERVASQIENGGGGMPPNLLEGADKDAVASYVAEASA